MCHPRFVAVASFVPVPCPMDMGMLEEGDVVMSLSEVSRMVSSSQMSDVETAYGAEHEDSPFCL